MSGIRKPMWWEIQGREKSLMIRFDTIPTVTDGQTRSRSKDRASRASRG